MTRVGVALFLVILIAGCSTGRQAPKNKPPREEQAIKVAVEHLKANGGLSEEYDVDVTTHDDGHGGFTLTFFPATQVGIPLL